jgi:hypothetical protein
MQFKTKSEQIAHGLIQSYIGPDHKACRPSSVRWLPRLETRTR